MTEAKAAWPVGVTFCQSGSIGEIYAGAGVSCLDAAPTNFYPASSIAGLIGYPVKNNLAPTNTVSSSLLVADSAHSKLVNFSFPSDAASTKRQPVLRFPS